MSNKTKKINKINIKCPDKGKIKFNSIKFFNPGKCNIDSISKKYKKKCEGKNKCNIDYISSGGCDGYDISTIGIQYSCIDDVGNTLNGINNIDVSSTISNAILNSKIVRLDKMIADTNINIKNRLNKLDYNDTDDTNDIDKLDNIKLMTIDNQEHDGSTLSSDNINLIKNQEENMEDMIKLANFDDNNNYENNYQQNNHINQNINKNNQETTRASLIDIEVNDNIKQDYSYRNKFISYTLFLIIIIILLIFLWYFFIKK